jgi:hypothetical protein
MRETLRFLRAVAAGAAVQYLFDPQLGRTRRARLADQIGARARRFSRLAGKKLRYQKGRLRGVAHNLAPGREASAAS